MTKLNFSINYQTQWGQDVRVELELHDDKARCKTMVVPLTTHNGVQWTGEAQITEHHIQLFTYKYVIYQGPHPMREEWCTVPREFKFQPDATFYFPDAWKDIPFSSYMYSSAFTECVHTHPHVLEKLPYFEQGTLYLKVDAPMLKPGQAIAVLGSQPVLGEWNTAFAFRMKMVGMHTWGITLSTVGINFPMEYKYVIVDEATGEFIAWEGGDNRSLNLHNINRNDIAVITDSTVRLPELHWKCAGVVIPVFSLRTAGSQGIGDFGDLRTMVDWAVKTGMKAIQILPINDTTIHHSWLDSYPYNSISIYALGPQYLDLRQLPLPYSHAEAQQYETERESLNALPEVDFESVMALKNDYIKAAFAAHGEEVLQSKSFAQYFKKNETWLVPYAAFSVLRDINHTAHFKEWPKHATYDANEIRAFCAPGSEHYAQVSLYYYIQYNLHLQLSAASSYARSKGVIIKGDIPIGISRDSVESWVEPFYFNNNGQTGAPPDDFSVNGQNWGFPTYNWKAMQADGCRWWVNRFKKMAEYFDAYRIDHVLGFFRIWEIPTHSVHGLLGYFSPALPLSVDEIENYGLHFRRTYFTQPYINDWVLDKVFGEKCEEVKHDYLEAKGIDWYVMKPQYDTQRKVQAAFHGRDTEEDIALRDGLYTLISNVLFIEDPYKPNHYHPRISAQQDYIYHTLSLADREAFNRLYEDFYYHRHNEFWYAQAMQKLPVLTRATRMLVCAEDLGMVPQCVPWVMNDLRILTLEIQTMPKAFGLRFGHLEDNPYRSVATIFTHDMPTLRMWWEEDAQRRQAYYNEVLQKDGEAPQVIPAWLCEEVVARHLYSPSMLALISWQDWMSMSDTLRRPNAQEERINVPSNPHNYWHYRMHMNIEQLMLQDDFNNHLARLIAQSGRG